MTEPDWYLFEFGDRNSIISKNDHLVNDEGERWTGFQQRVTPLYEHAADVERLQHNEVIYKAQIKNLHRLLGMLVHGLPGTPTYNKARAEAAEVVLTAYMSEYRPGEIANND